MLNFHYTSRVYLQNNTEQFTSNELRYLNWSSVPCAGSVPAHTTALQKSAQLLATVPCVLHIIHGTSHQKDAAHSDLVLPGDLKAQWTNILCASCGVKLSLHPWLQDARDNFINQQWKVIPRISSGTMISPLGIMPLSKNLSFYRVLNKKQKQTKKKNKATTLPPKNTGTSCLISVILHEQQWNNAPSATSHHGKHLPLNESVTAERVKT